MSELITIWTDDDGTRCVLCGDATTFQLRVVRTDGHTTHAELVSDLLHALQVRAFELRQMIHAPSRSRRDTTEL